MFIKKLYNTMKYNITHLVLLVYRAAKFSPPPSKHVIEDMKFHTNKMIDSLEVPKISSFPHLIC